VPHLKARLHALSGGAWCLEDFDAYAAGSDVDLMAHIVEAVAARDQVVLFPGDWYGFLVGSTHPERIRWSTEGGGAALACLCIPSVRNGHLTQEMLAFLHAADSLLLNLNLYPTLAPEERHGVAEALAPLLPRSLLSISFSRGFGLTASQLGVLLVPKGHTLAKRFAAQWRWFTYFYNAIAARAFVLVDGAALEKVDHTRRAWAAGWLAGRGLPVVTSGSYYVKSFRLDGELPESHRPLARDGVARLCLKPPQV
jgi:hypothetical protein